MQLVKWSGPFGKGCDMTLEGVEFNDIPYHQILSEKDLEEVFAFMYRVGKFYGYCKKTNFNNVYMDYDILQQKMIPIRLRFFLDRLLHKMKMLFRTKRMNLDFESGRVYTETARCNFILHKRPQEDFGMAIEEGKTEGLPLSHRQIMDFYYLAASDLDQLTKTTEIILPEKDGGRVLEYKKRKVIFQALLIDDMSTAMKEGYYVGNIRSVILT